MSGVHATRLAALEIEQDSECASILLSAAENALAICMSCRSANLKIAVSMCKRIFSSHLRYTVRLVDSFEPLVTYSSIESDRSIEVANGTLACIIFNHFFPI